MSDTIEWDNNFAVNIPSIDAEHKKIFDILNRAFSAKETGRGSDFVERLLEILIDYSISHLAHEEKLLVKYQYPAAEEPMQEHRDYVQKVSQMQADTLSEKEIRLQQLIEFLKGWWIHHVQMEDKKYSAYLFEKGAR